MALLHKLWTASFRPMFDKYLIVATTYCALSRDFIVTMNSPY